MEILNLCVFRRVTEGRPAYTELQLERALKTQGREGNRKRKTIGRLHVICTSKNMKDCSTIYLFNGSMTS